MTNSDIKAGDVVQLKSGGPKMTVEWLENEEANCVWFEQGKEGKHPVSRKFNIATLEHYKEPPRAVLSTRR